ncbi:Secreted protein, partial [human gut metagenome]
TGLLRQGDNEVVVRVSSSLSNRLKARGYYDALPDVALMLAGGEPRPHQVPLRGYGLQGPVRLVQG